MMMVLLVIVLLISAYLFYHLYYKRIGLPPGPMPYPKVGNTMDMVGEKEPEKIFDEYKAKYGSVVTFWIGNTPMILLNTKELADEYMIRQGDIFVDRIALDPVMKIIRGGESGLINMSGDLWRNQRRFALKVMRDFGLGKSGMEERLLSEALFICEKVNKDIDAGLEDIDLKKYLDLATGSVINTVVCGESFTALNKEDDFYKIQDIMNIVNNGGDDQFAMLLFLFPFLLQVPYINKRGLALIEKIQGLLKHIDKQVDDHLQKNNYSDQSMEPRDFIDAFMLEKARLEENGEDAGYFTKEQLRGTAIDLWFAGHDTTSATMSWIVSYLCYHQEIQNKLHDEIDRVISSDRQIRTSDRPDLPYLLAFITEVQRLANIVPFNVPRVTTEDVNIDGFHIKKGTAVLAQIGTIMRDEKNFSSPFEFKPERFIDNNGKFVANSAVLPFSLGRRSCLGEGLARMELYLFTANLLNQFKILPGKTPPTLKKIKPSSFHAALYTCKMEKRY
ncbi:unnamed protein product [Bursaphelenchus xylophilus]|uniref:(pine wood nematode) hypothetical protein n=1 Tax=Bursaphelenchus xylophilus TaxID=6326 RepID=A0A1I7SPV8_BURXY|nr:unnamed protein product [Bursaphelenchus xylophilus]CAG9109269.1 unnamed protein product [Bursaphelenchus xylophilus]